MTVRTTRLPASVFWLSRSRASGARRDRELGPADDVEARINAAQPGDEIVLRGGTYTLNQRFSIDVRGTQAAPIVFRAKDGQVPIIHQPDANQNVIDVVNAEYLIFRGLEITGGSHGLRLIQARFVTVEGCNIHDTGDVALSANSGGSLSGPAHPAYNIHHTTTPARACISVATTTPAACSQPDRRQLLPSHHGPTVDQGDGIEIKRQLQQRRPRQRNPRHELSVHPHVQHRR